MTEPQTDSLLCPIQTGTLVYQLPGQEEADKRTGAAATNAEGAASDCGTAVRHEEALVLNPAAETYESERLCGPLSFKRT